MGVVFYKGWLTAALLQLHPEKKFVFGDNLRRIGKGGQAIIRDEPNAIGVATKRRPSMAEGSFFEFGNLEDLDAVLDDLKVCWNALKGGATLVVPVTHGRRVSLGLERAELDERASDIYQTIVTHFKEMAAAHGEKVVEDADGL